MTHELKKIIQAFQAAKSKQLKTVLATVVALEGSSYRRPGVRMLIREDGKTVGAVSGGCVEKEVLVQSRSVFADSIPKMMTYDGRYRLGCEGILYILIEPFDLVKEFLSAFEAVLKDRSAFWVSSYYRKEEGISSNLGSIFEFGGKKISLRPEFDPSSAKDSKPTADVNLANGNDSINKNGFEGQNGTVTDNLATKVFEQEMQPCFKLIIIGAEHDAVQLCLLASLTGWEVSIIAGALEAKELKDFPGAEQFKAVEPEMLSVAHIDERTALMVMTHSYVRDLKYLLAVKDTRPAYLGLLGPSQRRERLLGELIERNPLVSEDFIDSIHGPAGLNIGAETAQEIAVAIISEILSVVRNKKPMMLKNKSGRIHS